MLHIQYACNCVDRNFRLYPSLPHTLRLTLALTKGASAAPTSQLTSPTAVRAHSSCPRNTARTQPNHEDDDDDDDDVDEEGDEEVEGETGDCRRNSLASSSYPTLFRYSISHFKRKKEKKREKKERKKNKNGKAVGGGLQLLPLPLYYDCTVLIIMPLLFINLGRVSSQPKVYIHKSSIHTHRYNGKHHTYILCIHTYIHINTFSHTHTHTHMHIYTYTYTQYIPSSEPLIAVSISVEPIPQIFQVDIPSPNDILEKNDKIISVCEDNA